MNYMIATTALLLACLAACGDGGGGGPSVPTIPDLSGTQSLPTSFAVGLANYDADGHAAWMMWQDGSAAWSSAFLTSLPAVPAGNSVLWTGIFQADPGTDYWLVLADMTGVILDSVDLGTLAQGHTRTAFYRIVGAKFVVLLNP